MQELLLLYNVCVHLVVKNTVVGVAVLLYFYLKQLAVRFRNSNKYFYKIYFLLFPKHFLYLQE